MESAIAIGWMAGPAVGGCLGAWAGFRMLFYCTALFVASLLPAILLLPKGEKPATKQLCCAI